MALELRARGQIRITDLTDSRQLVAYIGSSNRRQVIYDPNTKKYQPDYGVTPNILTPELYIAGSSVNQIKNVKSLKWYVQVDSTGAFQEITENDTYAIGEGYSLTIKKNVLDVRYSMLYKAEIVYHDTQSNRDIIVQADIELVKLENGLAGVSLGATTAVLTNDTHTIPTDYQGNNGSYFGAETQFIVFEGTEDKTEEWAVTATPSAGITGSMRDLGTTTEGENLYNQATAKKVYMDNGVEKETTENDYTSDFIPITVGQDYIYRQKYINNLWYTATPYTTFTYYDADKNYLFEEKKIETVELEVGENKTYTYNIKATDARVKFIRTNGNLLYDGAFFATYSATPVADKRIIYDVTGITVDSGYVEFRAQKGAEVLTKRFTLTRTKSGYTPVKGTDYFDGKPGQDGKSSYLWVRYSQNADGNGMTTNPTGAKYIGVTTTETTSPPGDYKAYQWVKFQGETGLPGEDGSRLHLKYSNDGGKTFTANNGEDFGTYLGKLVDFEELDSTNPADYTWGKITGDNAVSYRTVVPATIKKDKDGKLVPASIAITTSVTDGKSNPALATGYYRIQKLVTYNGAQQEVYKSTLPEQTVNFTVPTDALRLTISFGLEANTYIETQTIEVVKDGDDSLLLTISTPNGDSIRNHAGTLTAVAEAFKGTATVTPTAHQWYLLNPSSAGDSDSGTGWHKLTTVDARGTSGFTTKTLTITPSAINGTATFMVIATYKGVKYKRQVTVSDIMDAYTFATIGNGFFKNAQGTNTYTQKVYLSGVEVDKAGTQFRYEWVAYDANMNIIPGFSKIGKTITVSASEHNGSGLIYCIVSD